MNLIAPVSTLMTKNLITVNPEDTLEKVNQVFEDNNIHHLPVVRFHKIVGIISQTDFKHFLHGYTQNQPDGFLEKTRLGSWKAEDIMTKGLGKVESTDKLRTVVDIFKMNRFHALPVVDNDDLVGIITVQDIINALAAEHVSLDDYKAAKNG
ncbi:MAG: CBS domain-containing protein [Saprospiraceae bacterium]|nr:CBS domain-containing protein [Saprospiraceae bacterium]